MVPASFSQIDEDRRWRRALRAATAPARPRGAIPLHLGSRWKPRLASRRADRDDPRMPSESDRQPYDAFLSCKHSAPAGGRTRDSEIAEALEAALVQRGVRTFRADTALQQLGRADYSRAIAEALELDLAVMFSNWGLSGRAGDVNEDGTIDGGDLAAVLAAWTF